jgi:hypothetical protein
VHALLVGRRGASKRVRLCAQTGCRGGARQAVSGGQADEKRRETLKRTFNWFVRSSSSMTSCAARAARTRQASVNALF